MGDFSNDEIGVIAIIIYFVVIILIFLIIRYFDLWYYQIDKRVNLMT